MKIIREGRQNTYWQRVWDCPHCMASWEMEAGDPPPDIHIAFNTIHMEMYCPECSGRVILVADPSSPYNEVCFVPHS